MSVLTLSIKGIYDYLRGKPTEQEALASAIVDTLRHPAFRLTAFPATGVLNPVESALESQIKQLKFLLASAPMIEVPANSLEARQFVKRPQNGFAYVHPKTMARITFEPLQRYFMVFPGSSTKWVLTSLMPENRVVFSLLPIPGLEKILAQ